MTTLDLTKLPDYLKHQRWFSGKAWPIKHVTVMDHATIEAGGCAFSLAVVEVVYELGSPERYLLPVQPSTDGVRDALENDACMRGLFDLIRTGGHVASAAGRVEGEWIAGQEGLLALPSPLSVRRLQVEQSNTSVVLGEQVILKIIRKLEAGVNPEHEVGRFLATRTSFRATPSLLGALHLEGTAGATLAVAHRFVPDATDGWKYTLDRLREERAVGERFLSEMRDLGMRVGELHLAFASASDEDPAFAPEPLLQEDLQRWSASIVGELGVTLADASRQTPDLERGRETLIEHAKRLAQVTPSGQKIRIHGDLHLGQVLRAQGQWLIFDFEGEPARSFTARREKYSALRDVAGMIRSFDYAEATVALEGGTPHDRAGAIREAFVDGYRQVTRGAAFLPSDEGAFDVMLRAFELEKLLYEVRYELQNRPDWVRIPVQALLRMEAAQ
ncbi:maltokinase N-terminal cap-like domain-containing protein [Corallococcus macrosporus]|uniref:Maltokinase n=2 Tax=Myxococcaceae TaxID=31 RepID=A0A250JWF0_9BACT|nr:phosphotransferase [Corallococcus macrosporus]AEI67204.1 putative sugar phosphotransferase [Corallococcus macrosporus]ATB47998.1 sugar phosphotransferase [Corallococcus macrosporus DSM 14697]